MKKQLADITFKDLIEAGKRLNSIINERIDSFRGYNPEEELTDEQVANIIFAALDVSPKDEEKETDNLKIREYLKVPEINFDKFQGDCEEKYVFTFEEEAELLLNDINSCSGNIEVKWPEAVSTHLICRSYYILSESIRESNCSFIRFALKDIAFRVITLLASRRRQPLKSPDFNSVITEMIDLHRRKNADYGSSFDKSLDEDGLLVAKIRIGDKVNRFLTLTSNETQEAKVSDESIQDTLIDLANYCLMTIVWMKNNNPNKK